MAHHKSALKRIRQNAAKRIRARYYKKSTRTAMRNLLALKDKTEAQTFLPKVISMIDKLGKTRRFHPNKASNLKGKLMKHVGQMA
jgi:small subunit ribosomal protein S20